MEVFFSLLLVLCISLVLYRIVQLSQGKYRAMYKPGFKAAVEHCISTDTLEQTQTIKDTVVPAIQTLVDKLIEYQGRTKSDYVATTEAPAYPLDSELDERLTSVISLWGTLRPLLEGSPWCGAKCLSSQGLKYTKGLGCVCLTSTEEGYSGSVKNIVNGTEYCFTEDCTLKGSYDPTDKKCICPQGKMFGTGDKSGVCYTCPQYSTALPTTGCMASPGYEFQYPEGVPISVSTILPVLNDLTGQLTDVSSNLTGDNPVQLNVFPLQEVQRLQFKSSTSPGVLNTNIITLSVSVSEAQKTNRTFTIVLKSYKYTAAQNKPDGYTGLLEYPDTTQTYEAKLYRPGWITVTPATTYYYQYQFRAILTSTTAQIALSTIGIGTTQLIQVTEAMNRTIPISDLGTTTLDTPIQINVNPSSVITVATNVPDRYNDYYTITLQRNAYQYSLREFSIVTTPVNTAIYPRIESTDAYASTGTLRKTYDRPVGTFTIDRAARTITLAVASVMVPTVHTITLPVLDFGTG